jgi:uncharacterized RDD family membrane protein YckC
MKAKPKTISIIGPEGTPLEFPLGGGFERFAAFSVDMLLLFIIIIVMMFALAGAFVIGSSLLTALGLVLFFAIRHGYFLFFETFLQGSTPGKRMLKLRVIARDGGRLRVEAIVARNLMRDLEVFVPLVVMVSDQSLVGPAPWWLRLSAGVWALIIGAMPLYTSERSRAGDLIGGTVVVAIPKATLIRDESSRGARELVFTREELSVYGEHELETLAELLRSMELGRASTEDLRLVATTIQKKIKFEGSEPTKIPLEFLRVFYSAQRAELEKRLVLGKRKASKHDAK